MELAQILSDIGGLAGIAALIGAIAALRRMPASAEQAAHREVEHATAEWAITIQSLGGKISALNGKLENLEQQLTAARAEVAELTARIEAALNVLDRGAEGVEPAKAILKTRRRARKTSPSAE